VRQQHSSV